MLQIRPWKGIILLAFIFAVACSEIDSIHPETANNDVIFQFNNPETSARMGENTGVLTANGWYEEEEIYYILLGVEEGVTERGKNQLYLIGGDRVFQANVALFIPGEAGYSPHWNVNVVHTTEETTVQDILDSPYSSMHFDEEGVLFDDVEDVLRAADAGLVTITKPGVVVNCPIISEEGAEAPGNTELSEEFPPFDLSGGF